MHTQRHILIVTTICIILAAVSLLKLAPASIQASGPDAVARQFMDAIVKEDYETVAKLLTFTISTDEAQRVRKNLIRSIDEGSLSTFSLGEAQANGSVQEVIYFDSAGARTSYEEAMAQAQRVAETSSQRAAILQQYGTAMQHFAETVLQQKGTVDAATERDANMGYQLLAQLNDQLCNKKVIDHVSEWRVGVTWPAHSLPAGKLLTLLTIVPRGSEYRIAQVYGGDSVNQLLLDEHTKMFGDEQVGLPPVEH